MEYVNNCYQFKKIILGLHEKCFKVCYKLKKLKNPKIKRALKFSETRGKNIFGENNTIELLSKICNSDYDYRRYVPPSFDKPFVDGRKVLYDKDNSFYEVILNCYSYSKIKKILKDYKRGELDKIPELDERIYSTYINDTYQQFIDHFHYVELKY